MAILILGLVIFIGMHLVRIVAPGLRDAVMAQGGKGLWHAVHGVTALIGIALIAYGFALSKATSGMLYVPPRALSHIAITLMLVACICLVAAWLPAGKIRSSLKHPALVAIKIWAVAHLMANGEVNSVLLFTSVLAWAVILRISRKRSFRAGTLTYPPFVSYLYDGIAVVLGTLVWGLFIWKLHEWLIGVAPIVIG